MPAEPKTRTRLDAEERRVQILDVARRLFGEKPYAAVSLAEVARESGVVRGLVNHYFGSKRALYLEVLRDMMAAPERAIAGLAEGSLEQRCHALVDRFLTVVERNRAIWLVTVDAMSVRGDSEAEDVMREAEDVTVGRVITTLELEDVADERLRAAIRAYGGMARSASAEWLTHGTMTRSETLELLAATMAAVIRQFTLPLARTD